MTNLSSMAYMFMCLSVLSWPSHRTKIKVSQFGEINTGMIHNNCCHVKEKTNNSFSLSYPVTYSNSWQMFHMDNCFENPACPQPPYQYPENIQFSRISTGKTFYDSRWRGGSQVQIYNEYCIPIFEADDPPSFSCQFYLIHQQAKAYMTTKGAPESFGECCILAQPFYPPARNFTSKMNYGGIKKLEDKPYFEFSLKIPGPGPFVHGFWSKETAQGNYAPAFFYMTGEGKKWLFQKFKDFKQEPFNSQQIFAIPLSCKTKNIKPCPLLGSGTHKSPSQPKKHKKHRLKLFATKAQKLH